MHSQNSTIHTLSSINACSRRMLLRLKSLKIHHLHWQSAPLHGYGDRKTSMWDTYTYNNISNKLVDFLSRSFSRSVPPFRFTYCVSASFSWEWNFIIIHRAYQCSSKCLFDEICEAAAIGKSELYDCVVTAVSGGSVAHFSRLGERVRRLAEDAAFLSRRFFCFSGFPSFSLFLRTLEHQTKEIRFSFWE